MNDSGARTDAKLRLFPCPVAVCAGLGGVHKQRLIARECSPACNGPASIAGSAQKRGPTIVARAACYTSAGSAIRRRQTLLARDGRDFANRPGRGALSRTRPIASRLLIRASRRHLPCDRVSRRQLGSSLDGASLFVKFHSTAVTVTTNDLPTKGPESQSNRTDEARIAINEANQWDRASLDALGRVAAGRR